MVEMTRHAARGQSALLIGAVSIGAVLITAVAASAAPLNVLAGNVQPTAIFDADAGANGQWAMPGGAPNGAFTGGTVVDDIGNVFFVDPFSMLMDDLTWSGNNMIADMSGTGPYAAGQAAASFGPGGSFALTGTVYDLFMSPVFSGVLLTGTVGAFSLEEPSGGADHLQLINDPILTPTGGALADGTVTSMLVPYYLSLTIAGAQQNGGPLVDFQSDIQAIDSMQFELTAVPEPGSILLVLGGIALLSSRRR
jgi:hypothetical protein